MILGFTGLGTPVNKTEFEEPKKEVVLVKAWEFPPGYRNEKLYRYFTETILGPQTLANTGYDPTIHFREYRFHHPLLVFFHSN
jgi:hypothetical protein